MIDLVQQSIIALDPDFDFSEAYKRNYYGLLNISIMEVQVEQSCMLNGIDESLQFPTKLLCVCYREWRNSQWYPLEGKIKKSYYWTSAEKANDWKKEMIKFHELERLSEEDAFELTDTIRNL